jgi:hypothetical protein
MVRVCAGPFRLGWAEGMGGQMSLRLLLIVEGSHEVLFAPLSGAVECFFMVHCMVGFFS